jgi:hypothetical protein
LLLLALKYTSYCRKGASEDAVLRIVFEPEEVEAKIDWR